MAQSFRLITNNRRLSQKYHHQISRSFGEISTINWVRDRALDHAVEKENNLKPIINVKNFIKSEPSKSTPISILVENREKLQIPTRPIEFIRKFPSVFEQFLPGGIGVQPHIRLTPETLNLEEEEQLMYQSETYRKQAADRLLKVLMLTRTNKIPLCVVDRLKWDLGLPQDYVEKLLPEFPDYFHVTNNDSCSRSGSSDKRVLELVCWSNELAVSVMEKRAMKGDKGYTKGMPISFPVEYSRGFEMDKKFKKWVDDWQKLPYVSPYENAFHLAPTSDESDKWSVSVLHELLHILVPKKTEKENLLCIGEYLGLRSRFKRSMLQHPGILYVSSKNRTHTVVLREGYKRDLLIEKHVLMGMRSQYVHLMNTPKELPISKSEQNQGKTNDSKCEEEKEGDAKNQDEGELHDSSDSEVDDTRNGNEHAVDDEEEDEVDSEDDNQIGTRKNYAVRGERNDFRPNVRGRGPPRIHGKENPVKGRIRPSRIHGKDCPLGRRDASRGPSIIQGEENPVGGRRRPSRSHAEENSFEGRNPSKGPSRVHGEENLVKKGRIRPSRIHGKANLLGGRDAYRGPSTIQGEENPVNGRRIPSRSHGEGNPGEGRNLSRGHGKENSFKGRISNKGTSRSHAEENPVEGRSPRRGPSRSPDKENQDERDAAKSKGRVHSKFSLRTEINDCQPSDGKFSEKSNSPRPVGRSRPGNRTYTS